MAMSILKKLAFLTVILNLTSCASLPPKAPIHQTKGDYGYLKEYMNWFIQKEMKDNKVVGLSIALVDDQKIVWQKGFGHADLKNKIAATPETLYRAGSISKLFNGMAAMKLVEAGKMDIDLPLVTYLPEFKIKSRFGSTDGITARTIMTHHSGLPRDWIDGMFEKSPRPFTRLVQVIKDEYVAYPPNTIMYYSNIGMTLLGHAIQNCSGQAYADFLDQSLLKPLGMTKSRFETGITGDLAAKSYSGGKEVIEYPLGDIPAGGLNTTATDLAHLAKLVNNKGSLQNRRIISPASLDAMLTVQNNDIPLDLGNSVGLAWFIDENRLAKKEPVYNHSGAVIAHRATFMVAPKSKIGVVVLSNTDSTDTQTIAGKLLQMAWETKNGKKLPLGETLAGMAVYNKTPSDFKGTFSTLMGKVHITEKSAERFKVKSSIGNLTLKRGKDNQYHLSYRLWGIIPINLDELGSAALTTENISGKHLIIAQFGQERMIGGVRVAPQPIHVSWKSRLGQYKLINPPAVDSWDLEAFELGIDDGYLLKSATYDGDKYMQILYSVNATEATAGGLGENFGETMRIIKDDKGGEILTTSGLRYKRIQK